MTDFDLRERVRSSTYYHLARLFEPPAAFLHDERVLEALQTALTAVNASAAEHAAELVTALEAEGLERVRREHMKLFVGPEQLLAPPYGSVYLDQQRELMGPSTMAVVKLYAEAGLRQADGQRPLRWVSAPLKPRTLATTRLAEHWTHALDITVPLGVDYPDTARLRHIAWLAHTTLPYAFTLAGAQPREVYCELVAPDRSTWRFGSPEAGSAITGAAGAFCRVGAQRLAPEHSGLATSGPHGATALRVLRTYAG